MLENMRCVKRGEWFRCCDWDRALNGCSRINCFEELLQGELFVIDFEGGLRIFGDRFGSLNLS